MVYRKRERREYHKKAYRENFRRVSPTQRELAESMATDLMTGGKDGITVDRLSLMHQSYDIGGWSHMALANQIEKWIIGELVPPPKYDQNLNG